MYTLILTLIVLGSPQQNAKPETSISNVPDFTSKAACEAAGKASENKRELNSIDEKSWKVKKTSVCVNKGAN